MKYFLRSPKVARNFGHFGPHHDVMIFRENGYLGKCDD